ncbi:MAG: hypothetical protein ABJ327_05425 [Litoreibacter sp.]
MTIWCTADTHFGHENIIPFSGRPFQSASHMDSVLIENMWKVVQPEDTLYVIGDFAFGPSAENGFESNIFQAQIQTPANRLSIVDPNSNTHL